MRRTFKLEKRIESSGGILDIPHIAFLSFVSVKSFIDDFELEWGKPPEGVCLPVTSPDGLNLNVNGSGLSMSAYINAGEGLADFGEIIEAFAKKGIDIYLLIDPTLRFCRTDALHIQDIVGDSSTSICIGNARGQELIGAILGTAVDEALMATKNTEGKLRGVVFDAVNLWPMGASEERIELTCFCHSCEKYISIRNSSLIEKFKTFPNPANLLLKDTGSGISHIHDFDSKITADGIVGLSKQKNFDKIFKESSDSILRSHAEVLLSYLKIRHSETVSSIKAIFSEALSDLNSDIKRIILCEGLSYDWTSGLFLSELDNIENDACDEVWFDPQQSDLFLKNMPFRSYLWRRSRYYIDAFLGFSGTVSDPKARSTTGVGRLSIDMARDMLSNRFGQALGASASHQSVLASLPPLAEQGESSKRIGFIGVSFDPKIGQKFIEGLDIPKGLEERKSSSQHNILQLLQDSLGQKS